MEPAVGPVLAAAAVLAAANEGRGGLRGVRVEVDQLEECIKVWLGHIHHDFCCLSNFFLRKIPEHSHSGSKGGLLLLIEFAEFQEGYDFKSDNLIINSYINY